MPYDHIELTDEQAVQLAREASNLTFASRTNRDKVWKCLQDKKSFARRSHRNQLYDPRYTVEGRLAGLTDQGLNNDYKHFHPALYMIERNRW